MFKLGTLFFDICSFFHFLHAEIKICSATFGLILQKITVCKSSDLFRKLLHCVLNSVILLNWPFAPFYTKLQLAVQGFSFCAIWWKQFTHEFQWYNCITYSLMSLFKYHQTYWWWSVSSSYLLFINSILFCNNSTGLRPWTWTVSFNLPIFKLNHDFLVKCTVFCW